MKGENCKATKKSKAILSVLFCYNARIQYRKVKEKHLVNGQSAKLHFFKNVFNLPCDYKNSSHIWMTKQYIFFKWLKRLNEQPNKIERKIIFLIDNCSAYFSYSKLSNVKIEFLRPNSTFILKPVDEGMVKNIKVNFRCQLVQNVFVFADLKNEVSKSVKVDLRKAINLIWERLAMFIFYNN